MTYEIGDSELSMQEPLLVAPAYPVTSYAACISKQLCVVYPLLSHEIIGCLWLLRNGAAQKYTEQGCLGVWHAVQLCCGTGLCNQSPLGRNCCIILLWNSKAALQVLEVPRQCNKQRFMSAHSALGESD